MPTAFKMHVNNMQWHGSLCIMWILMAALCLLLPKVPQVYDPVFACLCAFMAGLKFQRMLEE